MACVSWSEAAETHSTVVERSSPAVAFPPAQNHEIELAISLIHQVPCVPDKKKKEKEYEKSSRGHWDRSRAFMFTFVKPLVDIVYMETARFFF